MLPVPPALATPAPAPPLDRAFAEIARSVPGVLGAEARLLETGEASGIRRRERFPMQSVYKFPIAMAALAEVDAGRLSLDQGVEVSKAEMGRGFHSPLREAHPEGAVASVRELLRLAVAESDGAASDALMRLCGGAAKVEAYVRALGVTDLAVATTEREMFTEVHVQYRNWATPEALVQLLAAFEEGKGLSPASRALLRRFMVESTPGPKRLKGRLPAGTEVAHKTGTDGTRGGLTRATNDVGIITLPDGRRLLVAVLLKDSTASEEAREAAIAKVARAAWDHFTGPAASGR